MAKKFNIHNPTEMRLVNVLAHGEGLITRDDFVGLSNKTMLSRYKTEGYIREAKNAEKGVYEITRSSSCSIAPSSTRSTVSAAATVPNTQAASTVCCPIFR